jgi:PiT family inorganic phosphate transporter
MVKGLAKIGSSIVLSPMFGFLLAFTFMVIISRIFFKSSPRKVDKWGRRLQLVSASLYSLGHGGNDAQKTMGIIAVLLYSSGKLGPEFYVPLWVVLTCHAAMGLGTLFGGWRIVKTMGMKITKLKPIGGCCAETGGAISLFLATWLGVPVSTTHTITGSIMGVGAVNKFSAVRWGVAERIIWAWVLTIPASAFVSALTWWAISLYRT